MWKYLFIIYLNIFASLIGYAQSNTCQNATPFCTSSGLTYPASTGASSPSGPNYGCLWTQPNPAFFFLQIANAGNLTLNLFSTPANDIDFICWGPFTNPNTMCNNLTGGNIEDCSYSITWNETCQINNASVGDYYVILITNYSNSACNINFSQTGGTGSTDCCIAGDAGNNSSIDLCETDPNFNMENQLGGNPDNGGNWYNSNWVALNSNSFNPSINSSGTYAYLVQGNVISGSSIPCPSDTSYLTVNVNPSPVVNLPPFANLCDNDQAITLSTATPIGGTYSVNGSNITTFTPSVLNVGSNTIDYTYTDGNGCSGISSQNLIVDPSPFVTATTTNASCSGYTDGSATLNPSTSTISSYAWSDGQTTQTANNLTAGTYGYTVTDLNGCSISDSIIIYEPGGITATLNTTNINCNGGANGTISVDLQGTSASVSATYLWNTFATTDSLANLTAGTYTVNITDQNGCVLTESVTLTEPSPLSVSSFTTNINCNNGSDGAISLYISGGTPDYIISIPPYSQTLINGASSFITPQLFSAGTYSYSITDSNGCQVNSSISLINPNPLYSISTVSSCDFSIWNGNTYTTSGIYDTLFTSSSGCDSLVTLDLTIFNSSSSNLSITECDTYTWNGNTYTTSGSYDSLFTNSAGCDSLASLNLTINNNSSSFTNNIACDSFIWGANNQTYNTSGIFTQVITNASGCLHTDSLNLIINYSANSTSNISSCDSYNWNGNNYYVSGVYIDTLSTYLGCDSIATLNLTITDTTSTNLPVTSCDSFVWSLNGQAYTSSMVDTIMSVNANGCPHIDSLILTINNSNSSIDIYSACDSSTWIDGITYSISNNVSFFTSTNSYACDSIIYLDLTINNSTSSYLTDNSCNTYNWTVNNQIYNTSGVYTYTTTNSNGCIHTDTLNLIINSPTSGSENIFECNSYLWNSVSYSNSGIYTDTLTNIYGCDSIATINLTISDTSHLTTKITECNAYLWSVNNMTYTTSGTYIKIETNTSNGCVHIDSLILTINNPSYSNDTIVTCDTYTWNSNTYSVSGDYSIIFTNSLGCDSTANLNLSISYSTSTSFSISECDNYTWEGTTYNTSGVFVKTFNTIDGCDSIVTLNLIIINGSQDITTIISTIDINCFNIDDGSITLYPSGGMPPFSYLWSNGETTQNISNLTAGNYTFTITDSLGCTLDSASTVNQANEIFLDFIAVSPICRYDESTLSIHISNALSNTYTITLLDSILKSFIIDTNGLLVHEEVPITLTPNFSGEVEIVSLTDNNGCTRYFNDDVYIEVKPLPQLAINEEDICVGKPSYTLSNATPLGGTYYINDEMTDFFDVKNLQTGDYKIKYEYTDPLTSCSNTIVEIINIYPTPIAMFSYNPQITTILDPTINFINTSEDIISNEWIIEDGILINDLFNFSYDFKDTGEYNIVYLVSNIFNCVDSTSKTITIYPHYSAYFPSTFTPNNDGENDIFKPEHSGINSYIIRIYNKWGGLVYKGENMGWDGTQNGELVENGTYPYSILVQDYKDKPFIYTGIVTLIR